MTTYAATLESIRDAMRRVAPHIHRTPVLCCATISRLAGRDLRFKCENFQKVGAFKFRGACNAVFKLPESAARRGVVTHSSGNHAQAMALAARLRGIPAHIVMPTNAPAVKREAVEGYGGIVYPCKPTLADREATADRVVRDTGGTLIPPFNHPDVIAGQGTISIEFLQQCPDLAAIICPVGGGGLLSGVTIAAKALVPTIRIIAAEPANADDAARSKSTGSIQPVAEAATIADGLRTSLGDLTFPVVRDLVDEVVTVSEDEIIDAMKLVFERAKLVIEPSSAVAVAVALANRSSILATLNGPVGVILGGGNVDLNALPWLRSAAPGA
ncbi:MAG: pyridoxal-phosphate dependent enzyme [Phycisphaerae bacterium]|nr:pyridoxal-phosphate dependent enzyme [Phycisphaerae bacterium]